jgi:thiol-disulfide isomerase/thioredoxin
MFSSKILLITAGIIVLILGILFYFYFYKTTESFEDDKNTNKELNQTADLMYFFTDWCPHCKTAKPEWEKIKEYLDGNKINNYNIHCIEYDCSKQTPDVEDLMDKYKVEGYPTMKLRINGNLKIVDSVITYDNVIDFLKKNIP